MAMTTLFRIGVLVGCLISFSDSFANSRNEFGGKCRQQLRDQVRECGTSMSDRSKVTSVPNSHSFSYKVNCGALSYVFTLANQPSDSLHGDHMVCAKETLRTAANTVVRNVNTRSNGVDSTADYSNSKGDCPVRLRHDRAFPNSGKKDVKVSLSFCTDLRGEKAWGGSLYRHGEIEMVAGTSQPLTDQALTRENINAYLRGDIEPIFRSGVNNSTPEPNQAPVAQ